MKQLRMVNRDDIVVNIKRLLSKADECERRNDKITVTNEIYEILIQNTWFLHENPKFKNTIRKKIIEFAHTWPDAKKYAHILFPNKIFQDGEFVRKIKIEN